MAFRIFINVTTTIILMSYWIVNKTDFMTMLLMAWFTGLFVGVVIVAKEVGSKIEHTN